MKRNIKTILNNSNRWIFFLCSYNEQQTTSRVRFHSRSQLNTKTESVYLRKEFHSHRIRVEFQHDNRFIVSEH